MKLCFSTLGCPDWTLDEILSTAKDLGYDSIEVRGISNELYAPKIPAFQGEKAEKLKEKLTAMNLSIDCLSSACYLHRDEADYVGQAKEYISLANWLNVPYVRVLGDTGPEKSDVDIELVKENLKKVCENTGDVTVLIETNGIFADTNVLKQMLEELNLPNLAVLWDIHHPYRYAGEAVDTTWQNVGKYIRYIHLKDSKVSGGKLGYQMLGYGDVPVKACIELLKKEGFTGTVSLEWLKRWYPDLTYAGIVFAQTIGYIRALLG